METRLYLIVQIVQIVQNLKLIKVESDFFWNPFFWDSFVETYRISSIRSRTHIEAAVFFDEGEIQAALDYRPPYITSRHFFHRMML